MLDQLVPFLSQYANLPESEIEQLAGLLKPLQIGKSEFLVRPGESNSNLHLVISGLFRVYFASDKGNEYITEIVDEGHVVASYSDILCNRPSTVYIQALEPANLVYISYQELAQLYLRHPAWQEFGRKIAERLFIEREERERTMAMLSAEERYQHFCQNRPGLVGRLPQNQTALYLGINPVSLSRILNKKPQESE